MLDIINDVLENQKLQYQIAVIIGIWIATIFFVKYFGKFIKRIDTKASIIEIDPRTFKSIDRILDAVAIILAVAMSLSVLEISGVLYTTLTAFGVIGLMIGMAIKDLTSNIFAGIMMLFNPSFLAGDYIEVDSYAGTVEKMSLRMTIIKRSDGVMLNLPNTLLITTPILNYSAAEKRRVEITVGVANESDIEEALKQVRDAAQEHKNTLPEDTVDVVMTSVKDYAVDITLRFWVHPDHLRSSTSEVLKDITDRFQRHQVELAVPMRKYVGGAGVSGGGMTA